ncbi:MAG TPA: antitoxin family protein [Gemmataceae bacterium]|nr:antitoxin family protein [Gemmataceae bacterium]
MLGESIETVFENGVFRPLGPVDLPEHQRVTVQLPTEEEAFDEEVGYEPLPLQQCTTIRVKFKRVGDFGPIPYPLDVAIMRVGLPTAIPAFK